MSGTVVAFRQVSSLSTAACVWLISHASQRSAEASMADACDTGEQVSKETVEKLKAELAAKSEETAKLRAFKNSHDEKQREAISKLQPDIQSFVDTLIGSNHDYAADMQPIGDWARNCHQSQSLETALPLARVLSCASAQFKRTREEASTLSCKADSLGSTMQELEATKADNAAKAMRISELEVLCNDRQMAAEKMQEELAKAGILRDKFDFSKLSAREAGATDVHNTMTAVTSKASGGARVSVADELMNFVRGSASSTMGTHRIGQSGTGHFHLGATSDSLHDEIASAFKAM